MEVVDTIRQRRADQYRDKQSFKTESVIYEQGLREVTYAINKKYMQKSKSDSNITV